MTEFSRIFAKSLNKRAKINQHLMMNVIDEYYSTTVTINTTSEAKKQRNQKQQEKQWHKHYGHKTGIFVAVWNLINDILGPGTVGMGQYVAQSGLLLSIVMIVFFGVITTYTLCLVFNLAKRHRRKSMPELSRDAFGNIGFTATCLMIFLFNFGGLCAQFLMAGEIVPQLLVNIFSVNNFLTSRTAVLIYVTLILSPFAFMRTLSSFAIISFLSVAGVLSIALIVFYKALIGNSFNPPLPSDWKIIHPQALSALGGLSYLFVCHDLSFNVFDDLRHSTKKRYYTVVIISMLLTALTTGTVGICGYLLFFDLNLKDANVLRLLPQHDLLANFGRIIFSFNIALSIPYCVFMPRYAITHVVTSIFPSIATNNTRSLIFHIVSTVGVILAALTVGLVFTNLGVVFELTGGVSACSIAYIIPPLLVLKLEKGWFTLEKIGSFIILILGLGIFGCTLSSVIYGLVTSS
jgi:sodium-coupled neutral amino acid transporter 11